MFFSGVKKAAFKEAVLVIGDFDVEELTFLSLLGMFFLEFSALGGKRDTCDLSVEFLFFTALLVMRTGETWSVPLKHIYVATAIRGVLSIICLIVRSWSASCVFW